MNNKLIRASTIATGFLLLATTSIFAQIQTPQVPTTPKFEVITPSENQTVYGNQVPILFNVESFQIVDYQQNPRPQAGQGHVHLWLDDENTTAQSATKVTQDTYTISNVTYGNHTLRAELVTNDHKSLSPAQLITVNFKNEAIPEASTDAANTGFDKKTATVILVVVALVIIAAWWYTKDEDEEEMIKVEKKTKKSRRVKKRK